MSYSSIEKQREYQRVWARNKNKDGTRNIRTGLITSTDLKKLDQFEEVNTWNGCVRSAKLYVEEKKLNRLIIATLAIQSCKIRHGGDFRTEAFKSGSYGKTLHTFAIEIGIHPKTLSEWIRIKRFIVDHLNASDGLDSAAAYLAMRSNYMEAGGAFQMYRKIQGDVVYRNAILSMRYLRNALGAIKREGALNKISQIQRASMVKLAKELLATLQVASYG